MLIAMRAWLLAATCASLAFIVALAACRPNAVCNMGQPINDPSNRTLRRDIMKLGLRRFCDEMTSRSAPLRLAEGAPVTGRFFPQRCQESFLDNGDLLVSFDGIGYAFTPLSRKVSFTSAATVRYDQDFRCADDGSVYAYFDPRSVTPPDFHVLQIEMPGASLVQGWIGPYADNFGRQMASGQIGRGFTFIQFDDGGSDFDLGHLTLGRRPLHPFSVHGNERVTVESLTTQVASGERDFIGPVRIDRPGRAIYTTMDLAGEPQVAVMLIPKPQGDAALGGYINVGPVGPLPVPPMTSDVVRLGLHYQRAVPVAPGMYYVVIDDTVGPSSAASAAIINYSIQIGDAP
jgi:hypothetical protein